VARCVHDVDLDAVVLHGGVLGQDGDATLFFEDVAIHGALGDLLPVAELEGLVEHAVYESSLAVVDVRDNSNVTILHKFSRSCLTALSTPCQETYLRIKATKKPHGEGD
jgi:hypothetical protein